MNAVFGSNELALGIASTNPKARHQTAFFFAIFPFGAFLRRDLLLSYSLSAGAPGPFFFFFSGVRERRVSLCNQPDREHWVVKEIVRQDHVFALYIFVT